MAHDAIPRRSSTLADDAFTSVRPEPARGGPADRRWTDGAMPAGTVERRTTVRFAAAPPAAGGPSAARPPPARRGDPGRPRPRPGPDVPMPGQIMEPALPLTGVPPERPTSRAPTWSASRSRRAPTRCSPRCGCTTCRRPVGAVRRPARRPWPRRWPPASNGRPRRPGRRPRSGCSIDRPVPAATRPRRHRRPPPVERCAEERRLAEERCELATRARAQADVAADALRQAQRAYEAHEAAALEAASLSDARSIHAAKEAAQGGFRSAVRSAADPDALEAAARDWLTEINRINTEARDAAARATREHAAAAEIGATLDRLGLEADAARIGAENADAACVAARGRRGRLRRARHLGRRGVHAPAPAAGVAAAGAGRRRDARTCARGRRCAADLPAAPRRPGGDDDGRDRLAGDDADARRRWQLHLTGLVEAIIADAIEAAYLEFPEEHAFWGSFTRIQNRDISQALSSLGFRFDGLGGWIGRPDPVPARPVAGPRLRRSRPDARPPLAERGGDDGAVPRRRRSPPTSTSPAWPAT